MTGPEQHANTEAFKQWALAEDRPDAEWVITRKDARELIALAERTDTLGRDQQRWLAWSGGDYPDDSPGDVVSADLDGTIVLDDGITTWEPKRAAAWFKARADTLERERDEAREARDTANIKALRRGDDLEQARAETDRLQEALTAMVYVHPCNCGDGIPQGACARCRAVAILGFDPAALAGPQTKEQTFLDDREET